MKFSVSTAREVFELYSTMAQYKIISAYHGEFSQAVINMLLKQAKSDLSRKDVDRRTYKKTYSILVECLENIVKHSSIIKSHVDQEMIDGIVMLSNYKDSYQISVGNLIHNEEVNILREKIDLVNQMQEDELRKYHTTMLKESQLSEKGGAGLGIIEMALKSGNKLRYKFDDYNEIYAFFALYVEISNFNK